MEVHIKLLHLDAGITGQASVSRQLSQAIVDTLVRDNPGLDVVRRDLDADPIPHLDSSNVAALADPNSPILREFIEADVVVIGAPMYNLGIPSQLKAWFDRISVAGQTFRYTAEGPVGLAGGKTVIIASARGGFYAPGTAQADLDFHERYLKAAFGFVGIDDVAIVRAEGVAVSPKLRQAALQAALVEARQVSIGATALAA
ncbi:MAG TPA: NAD(P)H-dependent oxidoreductase [Caulobacteraceae bacterium]|nr:NAD(P)H-dependent oxidoreductase [Caulobacteraceae bacterium]